MMNNSKMITGSRVKQMNTRSNEPRNRFQREMETKQIEGLLGVVGRDNRGIIRVEHKPSENDVMVNQMQMRNFRLRKGDMLDATVSRPKGSGNGWNLVSVEKINGVDAKELSRRPRFEKGTPVYPDKKIVLETTAGVLSTRLVDIVAPIGKGQRGMIVSPPKAGKTTVIKEIAGGVAANNPEIHLMAVLVGERPEEVTDIDRHIKKITAKSKMPGETFASNFDEKAEEQTRVAEMALNRAKRLVEMGKDVVIVLDSITRLARAYNLAMPTSGRTLSGGFDPAALYPPKSFFGAARNFEENGSLTIIGTALVDTGSRMDELIYEEFKGTGNMELHLDRKLAERRIYPAIDVQRSSTRREDLLFSSAEYQNIVLMRRMLDLLSDGERTSMLVERLRKTKTNKEFLASLKED